MNSYDPHADDNSLAHGGKAFKNDLELFECQVDLVSFMYNKNTADTSNSIVKKHVSFKHSNSLKDLKSTAARGNRRKRERKKRPQKSPKKDHQHSPEESSHVNIERLKLELAGIQAENRLRDGFIKGLRNEINQFKHDLDEARTEEWNANINVQELAEEEEELRAYLDRSREKIPRLRRKIEKSYEEGKRQRKQAKAILRARKDYLCNIEKLKRFRKTYTLLRARELGSSEEDMGVIDTPRQPRRHGPLINWNANELAWCESNSSSQINETTRTALKGAPVRALLKDFSMPNIFRRRTFHQNPDDDRGDTRSNHRNLFRKSLSAPLLMEPEKSAGGLGSSEQDKNISRTKDDYWATDLSSQSMNAKTNSSSQINKTTRTAHKNAPERA
uniref:Uncharacterized protein n=1 Tax=Ditylum brightwellii TaxID=49249 RepID=A0A7S4QCE0_9STRA